MQREINKLLKRVSAEKLKNNHKECIELYNIIAGLHSDIGSYDEAIYYHEQALDISKTLGDRLNTAICLRYIGEAKASLGQFYQAIDFIKKYLDLAQKVNNKVEIQRAWTTLGRVYLMQAQDMKDNSNVIDDRIKEVAHEAEKRFETALILADSVRDQVGEKEFAQMTSGLLVNIGLIKDICGLHDKSREKFNRAIEICKTAKLKEDLYRCQVILASIYRQRFELKWAVKTSEEALITAKQIGKKLLICDALIERGFVKLNQRDFKEAKRSFAQAYLEKSPSEEDHLKAIRLTKLAHLISVTYDKIAQDNEATQNRMKLCDKLGDLLVAVNCYRIAAEFYRRALRDAKICSRPKSELAKILYSIAETYADDGQFDKAKLCYEEELKLRNGNDDEQCQSMIKIAHMCEYLNKEPEVVCQAYEAALAKAGKVPKMMYNVLKDYVPYLKKKSFNITKCSQLEETLLNIKSYPDVVAEIEAGDEEDAGNDLEDEVDNVEDVITDDEDNDEVLMVGRRRARGTKKFKPNEVGDTPLHEACIKGDLKRVKSLLEQGHEVNPRDNAGWIPLHEACNHGHYKIAECLIEHGADVSNRGLKGMSPLHDSATNGHYDIMRLLIKHGANVIALTDAGETVLSCLRDFKKRNYSSMSNRDITDYRYMEIELMNLMDKCGFNLMEEKIKNLRSNGPSTSSSVSALEERPRQSSLPTPRVRNNNNMGKLVSNPVKDYRAVIGTLKRKRTVEESAANEERSADLPAIYNTGANTSAPTKEWLIDDISRDKNIARRRSNLRDLLEEVEEEDDDDEDWVKNVTNEPKSKKSNAVRKKMLFDSGDEISDCDNEYGDAAVRARDRDTPAAEPPSCTAAENDEDDDVLIVSEQKRPTPDLFAPESAPCSLIEDSSCTTSSHRLSNLSSSRSTKMSQNNLITVLIEDRKLLVPVTDSESATIGWLKESIAKRYATLHGVTWGKPNLSLFPVDDSNSDFYKIDEDLCHQVIRGGHVRATISSWQLEPIAEVYEKSCLRLNIEPYSFIKTECKIIENKYLLDMTHTYWPKEHVKPATEALAWRDFTAINLSGATSMIDTECDGKNVLESMATWKKAKTISIKSAGLARCHFDSICAMMKLPYLTNLDLSFNGIEFNDKDEFKKKVEQLTQGCPKLKRLDMSHNLLEFVKSIRGYDSCDFDLAQTLSLKPTFGSNRADDFEILAASQKECEVYSQV